MNNEQTLAYFNYLRVNDKEIFEQPETWKRGTRIYMNLLEKYPDQKWFWSWNWAAAVFSFFWMIYRRMYVEGIFLLILDVMFSSVLISPYEFNVLLWSNILFTILFFIASGLFGTPYYLQMIRRDAVSWKTRKKNTDWVATGVSMILFTQLIDINIFEEPKFERIIGMIVLGFIIMWRAVR